MSTSRKSQITEEHRNRYRKEGFFILEQAIPGEQLRILREECQRFIDQVHAEMDAAGKDVMGLNHRNQRYIIGNRHTDGGKLDEFLFSDLMSEICLATLGKEAFLLNEQYILKCSEAGMKFAWHQDSDYVGHPHRQFVTCWCALDDVDESNGTVFLLPHARAVAVKADRSASTGDPGDDPGVPVRAPAGSIAVFSSTCVHRSSANTTGTMRRVYLVQYSPEIIMASDGSKPWNLSEAFLHKGQRVR